VQHTDGDQATASAAPSSSRNTRQRTCMSEVQSVRLSRSSCMIRVLSLYDSSPRVSSSAMASSKAFGGGGDRGIGGEG
jgi:hypothetical protein